MIDAGEGVVGPVDADRARDLVGLVAGILPDGEGHGDAEG